MSKFIVQKPINCKSCLEEIPEGSFAYQYDTDDPEDVDCENCYREYMRETN